MGPPVPELSMVVLTPRSHSCAQKVGSIGIYISGCLRYISVVQERIQ